MSKIYYKDKNIYLWQCKDVYNNFRRYYMNIKIDETYSIKSDLRNIMLVENKITEKGKNKGKPYEDYVGYYATIENALKAYLNFRINTSQATNFKLIMDEIKDIRKTIEKALEGTNYENYTLKLKGE